MIKKHIADSDLSQPPLLVMTHNRALAMGMVAPDKSLRPTLLKILMLKVLGTKLGSLKAHHHQIDGNCVSHDFSFYLLYLII